MNDNENWINQNPSEKKQPDISSIPEINSIPNIAGFESNQKVSNVNAEPKSTQQYSDKVSDSNSYYAQNQSSNQNNAITSAKASYYSGIKLNIPNSGGILSLGILSILSFCCCGGFLAPILSIIALVMASTSMKAYRQNPDYYTISSLNNIKAGKITSIIGLVLAGLFFLYIIFIYTIGNLNLNDINEAVNESWNGKGY